MRGRSAIILSEARVKVTEFFGGALQFMTTSRDVIFTVHDCPTYAIQQCFNRDAKTWILHSYSIYQEHSKFRRVLALGKELLQRA